MSFGGPGGGQKASKPIPPERGSFPLDHDGECKAIIAGYLRCLRRVNGKNDDDCRMIAKEYLSCRMEHNLMAPDEMRNLGFTENNSTNLTTSSEEGGRLQKSSGTSKNAT